MSTTKIGKLWDRLIVRGSLTLEGSFHIGSGSANRQSDMALRRDENGQVFIPGSSLAGLLRSAAEDLAPFVVGENICEERQGGCLTCDLFGWTAAKNASGGQASRLVMLDALPLHKLPSVVEIREHVGIDRKRGAARPNLLYNREVAPANTQFLFEFRVENPGLKDLVLLFAVIQQWQKTGFRLGGRTTAGLGRAKIEAADWYGIHFSGKMLLDYLLPPDTKATWPEYLPQAALLKTTQIQEKLHGYEKPQVEITLPERYLPQAVSIDLVLESLEPLLVVGSTPKLIKNKERGTDAVFVTRIKADEKGGSQDEVFLPGSGLRGLLRSQAEKIVRTLDYYLDYKTQEEAWKDQDVENKYLTHISACAITHALEKDEIPTRLHACYGGPDRMDTIKNTAEQNLFDHSCVICRMFGNTTLRSRLVVDDGVLVTSGKTKLFDHVAIDRFSGGAADAKKFDDQPLQPGEQFKIHIELVRPEPWMLGLLGLVIKDLCEGQISIGHATHRGYGRVRGWVVDAQALVLPGTKLASSLSLPTDAAVNSAGFIPVDLGFGQIFTKDGLKPPTDSEKSFLHACHQQFTELCQTVRSNQSIGSIPEANHDH